MPTYQLAKDTDKGKMVGNARHLRDTYKGKVTLQIEFDFTKEEHTELFDSLIVELYNAKNKVYLDKLREVMSWEAFKYMHVCWGTIAREWGYDTQYVKRHMKRTVLSHFFEFYEDGEQCFRSTKDSYFNSLIGSQVIDTIRNWAATQDPPIYIADSKDYIAWLQQDELLSSSGEAEYIDYKPVSML